MAVNENLIFDYSFLRKVVGTAICPVKLISIITQFLTNLNLKKQAAPTPNIFLLNTSMRLRSIIRILEGYSYRQQGLIFHLFAKKIDYFICQTPISLRS